MAVPTIVSSSPAASETNVFKNKIITITFSESVLASSVSNGTVYLKNTDTNEIIPCYITVSGATVSMTPTRVLVGDTTYRLTIVGANTAIGTPVKSATLDSFATTTNISFTTGSDIDIDNAEKTTTAKELEGEIDLPSNITILTETSYMTVLSTDPANREFAVGYDLSEITMVFSENIDSSTLDIGSVRVTIGPYYEEDEDMLAYPDTSDGASNFKWEEEDDVAGVPLDYTDLTGELSSDGDTVTWTKTDTRDFPRNSKVKVIITTDLKSVSGTALTTDSTFQFFIEPFPYVISVERVRDEFYPYVLSSFTDDLIGKALYKNALDAMDAIRWSLDFRNKNSTFAEYVLKATVVDIFDGLKLEEGLLSGQFKRLGDMAVRYDKDSGLAMSSKMARAVKDKEELYDRLRGRWTKVAREAVKGRYHPEQKRIWRTRLWKQDLAYALEGISPGEMSAGNTTNERAAKVPGQFDRW